MELSDKLCLRDYGIMLEDKPTDDQKQLLYQQLQFDIQNGFLDTSDAFYIMDTYNLEQAQMILSYRAKRNKQQIDQQKQAINAQTIQGQQQSAQVTAQLAQQQTMLEHQNKMEEIRLQGMFTLEDTRLKMHLQLQGLQQSNQVALAGHVIGAQSQENMQKRDMGMPEEQIQNPQAQSAGMEQNIPEDAMQ
jgi:hypothetical protein